MSSGVSRAISTLRSPKPGRQQQQDQVAAYPALSGRPAITASTCLAEGRSSNDARRHEATGLIDSPNGDAIKPPLVHEPHVTTSARRPGPSPHHAIDARPLPAGKQRAPGLSGASSPPFTTPAHRRNKPALGAWRCTVASLNPLDLDQPRPYPATISHRSGAGGSSDSNPARSLTIRIEFRTWRPVTTTTIPCCTPSRVVLGQWLPQIGRESDADTIHRPIRRYSFSLNRIVFSV